MRAGYNDNAILLSSGDVILCEDMTDLVLQTIRYGGNTLAFHFAGAENVAQTIPATKEQQDLIAAFRERCKRLS